MIALRKLAARLRTRKFSTAEVAAMFDISIVDANNIFEEVAPHGIIEKGSGKRFY